MNDNKHNIHERIYQFILKTLRFVAKLPKTFTNQQIIGQLIRSVTLMGANDQEANGTLLHHGTQRRKRVDFLDTAPR